MTVLTADKKVQYREAVLREIPMAEDAVIHLGAMVCINASGYAVPAAAVAGYKFAGWAIESKDNTDGSNGDLTITVRRVGQLKVVGSGLTQAKVGDSMYIVDDQTVQPLPAGTAVADEELVADAGGSLTTFEGTLANTGVVPGGVSIAATVGAAAKAMADDGNGNLFGEGVGTGIIDYATGYYRLNFDTAPDDDTAITASYAHTQVLVEAGKLAKYESATSGWLLVG
ncbi:MAG: hypothetical protein ABIK12_00350 [Pseudomonadota bacterium]